MKKSNFLISKLSIFFLLISSTSIVFSQKKINQNEINYDWGTIYLKGKVKKISHYYFDLTSSDSNTKTLSSEVLFNENGYIIENHQFNSEKELIRKIKYEYNSVHLLTKETHSEGSNYSIGYFYDDRSNLIKEITENFDSNSKMKTEYKYDVNNNLIEILEFDNLDSLVFRTKLIYNTKNQLVEKTTIDESMGVMTNNTYKYDSIGNKIMSKGGKIINYYYNKSKKLIKEVSKRKNSSFDYIKVYEYDSNDNLIEEKNLDADQKITYKSTYLYDAKGNLFQKTDFNGNQIELIREFNYEYFE
jgi:hypothetical protein